MANEFVVVFDDDGSVNWREPDAVPEEEEEEEEEEEPTPVTGRTSIRMAVLNQSNLPQATLSKWISEYQKVLDYYFVQDWIHVELVQRSANTWDPATEVPHFLMNGIDVQGAAGYHSIQVLNGNDIDAFAVTDVDSSDPDETFGHEIFELAANPTTSGLHQYWGDNDRLIMAEVCDPVTRAPHVVNGVKISAWVTQRYLQGDNQEDPATYDSSHWFGETPRVPGPKRRTPTGFQIFFNINTREITYEFGDVDPSVPWQMRELPIIPDSMSSAHIARRCAALYSKRNNNG